MSGGADELGTIAGAALLAREIDRARAGRPAIGHDEHEPCANCGAERVGPYCHRCGQAGHVHRNIGALVHDIAHGVFHFEGKFWRTLPLLAWRPGELTRRYVDGERAKFVSPMALFLFSVFLLFAVISGLAGHGGEGGVADKVSLGAELSQERVKLSKLEAKRGAETDADERADLDRRIAKQRKEVTLLDALMRGSAADPALKSELARLAAQRKMEVRTGVSWINELVNHVAENPKLALYKLKMNAYKYSWALIPISLPFLWLLFFWRRDVGLYDHAIFAIYSLSFMSLGIVVLALLGKIGLPGAIIALTALLAPPVHMFRQLKGAYRLGWAGALWRTVALLIITTITSALFLSFLIYLGSD